MHHTLSEDLDTESHISVSALDKKLNVLASRLHKGLLRSEHPGAELLRVLVNSFQSTHKAIRSLTRSLDEVDCYIPSAVSLTREQIEKVYAVALILEEPDYAIPAFQRRSYFKLYKDHLVSMKRGANVPRISSPDNEEELTAYLSTMKTLMNIPEEDLEVAEWQVDHFGTGANAPKGMREPKFPSPWSIRDRLVDKPVRSLLDNLYPEYEHFSGYTHSLFCRLASEMVAGRALSAMDPLMLAKYTRRDTEKAIFGSFVATCCAYTEIYAQLQATDDKMEVLVALEDLWEPMRRGTLIGKLLWEARGSHVMKA